MAHQQDGSTGIDESDLAPTQTAGYRVGEQRSIDELKNLDKDDEALNRWKQSLLGNGAAAGATGAKAVVGCNHARTPPQATSIDLFAMTALHPWTIDHACRTQIDFSRPQESNCTGSELPREHL